MKTLQHTIGPVIKYHRAELNVSQHKSSCMEVDLSFAFSLWSELVAFQTFHFLSLFQNRKVQPALIAFGSRKASESNTVPSTFIGNPKKSECATIKTTLFFLNNKSVFFI